MASGVPSKSDQIKFAPETLSPDDFKEVEDNKTALINKIRSILNNLEVADDGVMTALCLKSKQFKKGSEVRNLAESLAERVSGAGRDHLIKNLRETP